MRQAFTLIETILYITIVTTILVAVSNLGWQVVGNGIKSRQQLDTIGDARYISERIKYEIRNAGGVSAVGANSITLTNLPSGTTTIDLLAGKVRIDKGTGPININSDSTNVTALTFVNNTSGDNKTKNISFTLTVTSAYSGTNQLFKATTTLRSSAEIRSN